MRITLRQIIFTLVMAVASLSYGQQSFDPDDRIVPESVSKDTKNELLVMKMSNQNGEEFTAEFKSDKNERMAPSIMRQYLNDQELQMKQMAEFIRAYLSLPENFYRENLGGQVELHYLIRKLADDFFTLDYYHRLPFDLRNKIMQAYFVKYPDSQVEFFRRYMNMPHGTSSERIRAEFSKLPKFYQEEINKLYQWDQKNWNGRVKDSFARPLSTKMHGFPAQSGLFTVAIGAVMITKMMTDYSGNPAAFLQHLESIDDPMTHISFYSFMAASGFTQDYLKTKVGGLSGSKSVKTFRAAIPYIGMSAGLITSNIVHEVSALLSTCADHLLKPKKPTIPGQMDPCDEAQDEFFNFANKVETYVPMIFSMTLSTVGSTYAQKGIVAGASATYESAKKLSEQMAGIKKSSGLPHVEIVQERIGFNGKKTSWYKSVKAKDAVKIAKNIPGASKRFLGLAMNIGLTGRGWGLGPVTVATTLTAMLAQNYAFVLIDTYLMPAINKVMAQVLRASFLNSADKKMKESLVHHQTHNWSEKAKDSGFNMVDEIKNLQKQMNAWRTQNHSRFFTGVQVWSQIANTLLSEIYEAQNFYQYYVGEAFKGFKYQNKKLTNSEISKMEAPFDTQLTQRETPLFGIKPLGHVECGTGTPSKQACVTEMQLYMNYPLEMEGYQKNRLQYVINTFAKSFDLQEKPLPYAPKIEKTGIGFFDNEEAEKDTTPTKDESEEVANILKLEIKPEYRKTIQSLLIQLGSSQTKEISAAILKLNQELASPSASHYNGKLVLSAVRFLLGNPSPVLVKGALIPFIYHETRKDTASYSQVSRTAYGYYFNRHTEYLLFQMVCGPDQAAHNIVEEWNMNIFGREMSLRPPEFNPPKIVNINKLEVEWPTNLKITNGPKKTNFCLPVIGRPIPFESIYYAKFYVNGSDRPESFFQMLNRNIKPEILGAWNSPKLDSESRVAKWWDQNIESTMRTLFKRLDYNFQYLLVDLVQGLKPDEKDLIKTTKVSRSLLNSSLEELNVYLIILSETEKSATGNTWTKELNLKISRSLIDSLRHDPQARIASQTDLVNVITQIIQDLRSIEVDTINNSPRVTLNKTKADLSQFKKTLDQALKAYQAHLKSVGTKDQYGAEVQTAAFEALQNSVNGLLTYLNNTQIAKYDASAEVEKLLSKDNQQGQNKATVKSSSIPRSQ